VATILSKTDESVEQVTIEPDGTWHTGTVKAETSVDPAASFATPETTSLRRGDDWSFDPSFLANDDDDDDVVAISGVNGSFAGGFGGASAPRIQSPPSHRPRHISSSTTGSPATVATPATGGGRATGAKRPLAEVIDLTLTSDDEDEADEGRPIKRLRYSDRGSLG
jgi:E3 SUMO-protein ligase PIAS1